MKTLFRNLGIKVDKFLTRRTKPRAGGKAGRRLVEQIFPNGGISMYVVEKVPKWGAGEKHTFVVNVDEKEWYNLDDETQRKAKENATKYNAEIRTRWSL